MKNNKGVTLIELLVTVSLIGILVGVSGDLLFTIFRSFNKSSTIVNIQEEGNSVLNKIKTDAINANSVIVSSDGKTITLKNAGFDIKYEIVDIDSQYGKLERTTIDNTVVPPSIVTEDLFKTKNEVNPKYKLVISDGTDSSSTYSIFALKNANSTPKLLVIYLTVIPYNQENDVTPKDLLIEQANARLRTSIVLRGSYDRID